MRNDPLESSHLHSFTTQLWWPRPHGRQPRMKTGYPRNALAEVQEPSHWLEKQQPFLPQIPYPEQWRQLNLSTIPTPMAWARLRYETFLTPLPTIFIWGWCISAWVPPSDGPLLWTPQQDRLVHWTGPSRQNPKPKNPRLVFQSSRHILRENPQYPSSPLILNLLSFQRLLRYTPLTWKNRRHAKLSLMNIWRPDRLPHPSPHKPLPSSLLQTKTVHSALARIIAIWTPIPSATHTPCLLSLNWLMTWKTPWSLPSLMSDGDSTTFTFEKKTNGKECSSPLLDSLNPPSCSLDSVMDCPLSSPLWTTSSRIWSPSTGWRYTWTT